MNKTVGSGTLRYHFDPFGVRTTSGYLARFVALARPKSCFAGLQIRSELQIPASRYTQYGAMVKEEEG
jgi:hypothetical protein